MKEKIVTGSIVVLAVLALMWSAYFVTSRYISLQSQVNQIVTFLNQQIQSQQTPVTE